VDTLTNYTFASGRSSGLVLDSGGGITCAVAVHDGYALNKSTCFALKKSLLTIKTGIVKSTIAGDFLTRELYRFYQHKEVQIHPRYCLQKREVKEGQFEVSVLDFPGITKSYHEYMIHVSLRLLYLSVSDRCLTNISHDRKSFVTSKNLPLPCLKPLLTKSTLLPNTPRIRRNQIGLTQHNSLNIPSVQYELPDGKILEVGTERFRMGEYLFAPEQAEFFDRLVAFREMPSVVF